MTWVRRAEPPAPPSHQCSLPNPDTAKVGDLFRCDSCRDLWRVGIVPPRPNGSLLPRKVWRPARWWQRLRYRDRGTPRYQPEKIQRGGQVPAPSAKEPPVRDRVPAPPKPPADTNWITMEER